MKKTIILLLLIICSATTLLAQSNQFKAAISRGEKLERSRLYDAALREYNNAKSVSGADIELANRKIQNCQRLKAKQIEDNNRKKREETARLKALADEAFQKGLELFKSEDYSGAMNQFQKAKDGGRNDAEDQIARCVEASNKAKGYITVNDIQFGLGYSLRSITSEFGDPIYASDINEDASLILSIRYTLLDNNSHNISPQFKIINSKGKTKRSLDEMEDTAFTESWKMFPVYPGAEDLRGYIHGDFAPGEYICEMYINNNKVFSKPLILLKHPNEASYLTVNGKDEALSFQLNPMGGELTMDIDSDGPNTSIKNQPRGIEKWMLFTISKNKLHIKYRPNYTYSTIPVNFTIESGGRYVNIKLSQPPNNDLSQATYIDNLQAAIDGIQPKNNVYYKGEPAEKQHTGIKLWSDENMWFIGQFTKNNELDEGIYLSGEPNSYSVFGYTIFYVGTYSNGKRSKGSCYDRFGNLIFRGDFQNNQPYPQSQYSEQQNFFPSDHDRSHLFEYISDENGNAYLGETFNHIREGFGVFFWDNGDLWIGKWENGRSTEGTFISADGTKTSKELFEEL